MIDEIIKEIFHTNEYILKKINKGLTNQNFLLTVQEDKYMVRLPKKDSSHMMNYKQEKIVCNLVKELDSELVYFNEENGIKITKFIDNIYEYDEAPYEDKIERCAHLMKKLHQLPVVDFHFDSVKTLENYRNHVRNPLFDLSEYEYAIKEIRNKAYEPVLCHNDFVSGNILYSDKKDYLIDYEYAASNDPLFDVISFLGENQIFDETLRERFYKVYFEEKSVPYHDLFIMEVFQNILWCYWAMMFYETRHEDIYKEIANDKYNAIQRMHE